MGVFDGGSLAGKLSSLASSTLSGTNPMSGTLSCRSSIVAVVVSSSSLMGNPPRRYRCSDRAGISPTGCSLVLVCSLFPPFQELFQHQCPVVFLIVCGIDQSDGTFLAFFLQQFDGILFLLEFRLIAPLE